MNRAFNFCAGPAAMPTAVLQQVQCDLLDWQGRGVSVMEVNHRSEEFKAVAARAEADLRQLLNVSDDYAVLFLPGGARMQFSTLALNLLPEDGVAGLSIPVSGLSRLELSRHVSATDLALGH